MKEISPEGALKLFCSINILSALLLFVPLTLLAISAPFFAEPRLEWLGVYFLSFAYIVLGVATWLSRWAAVFWVLVLINAIVTIALLALIITNPEVWLSAIGGPLYLASNGGALGFAFRAKTVISDKSSNMSESF